jgi:hypothetical protein
MTQVTLNGQVYNLDDFKSYGYLVKLFPLLNDLLAEMALQNENRIAGNVAGVYYGDESQRPVNPPEGTVFILTETAQQDTTAPVVAAFTLPGTASALTFNVSSFTAQDAFGVTGYKITESSTPPSAGAGGWSGSAPSTVTASGSGSVTFYPWAKDAAGNVSSVFGSPRTVVITLADTTAPVVTAFTLPGTASSLVFNVSSFTATDAVGVTGYMVTESSTPPSAGAGGWSGSAPAQITASGSGSITFYPWAKDAAGNVSAVFGSPRTVVITLADTTAPVVTAFTLPDTASALTFNVSSFTATDAVGVTGYMVTESSTPPSAGGGGWSGSAPTQITASGSGSITFYPWAKDAAGNVSSVFGSPRTVVITLADTMAPVVTAFTLPGTASALTFNISSFTATDAVGVTGYMVTENSTPPSAGAGGWSGSAPAQITASGQGSITFYPWAKDAAGNVSAVFGSPRTVVITLAGGTKTTINGHSSIQDGVLIDTGTESGISMAAGTIRIAGSVTSHAPDGPIVEIYLVVDGVQRDYISAEGTEFDDVSTSRDLTYVVSAGTHSIRVYSNNADSFIANNFRIPI